MLIEHLALYSSFAKLANGTGLIWSFANISPTRIVTAEVVPVEH
jgi:hypothetical protein